MVMVGFDKLLVELVSGNFFGIRPGELTEKRTPVTALTNFNLCVLTETRHNFQNAAPFNPHFSLRTHIPRFLGR